MLDNVLDFIGYVVLGIFVGFICTVNFNNQRKIIANQDVIMSTQVNIIESNTLLIEGMAVLISDIINETQGGGGSQYDWFTPDHDELLGFISDVESGGDPNAVGDGGNALGMYQIWRIYWQDAVEHDPSIGGVYGDVVDPEYAERIVLAYWDRYGSRVDYSLEGLARIHNGGPNGHTKTATDPYWEKIELVMN